MDQVKSAISKQKLLISDQNPPKLDSKTQFILRQSLTMSTRFRFRIRIRIRDWVRARIRVKGGVRVRVGAWGY